MYRAGFIVSIVDVFVLSCVFALYCVSVFVAGVKCFECVFNVVLSCPRLWLCCLCCLCCL